MPKKYKNGRHKPVACPVCGFNIDDQVLSPLVQHPQPDQLTVCQECGSALVFNVDITLRLPSAEEVKAWPEATKKRIRKLQRDVSRTKRQ